MDISKNKKTIIGGAIENCVHVSGVYDFLRIAGSMGYKTVFLGAAVPVEKFIKKIVETKPDIVCVSYRLTPDSLPSILDKFFDIIRKNNLADLTFYFGGTPGNIEIAKKYPLFSEFFKGEENISEILNLLAEFSGEGGNFSSSISANAIPEADRMLKDGKSDTEINRMPLIRHHFGLPSLDDTISGIRQVAESRLVDVISIATDQNAQEHFFEPHKMNRSLDGAGGVPVRTEKDLQDLYNASQCGNFPRLRIYSGTKDLMKWAEMSVRTINNAWGAIPLFWYSILDGRSKRNLKDSIEENQKVIKWYAEKGIPVEINDSHHWSLRESSDVIAVVDSYISAYNAKKLGVKKYVTQLMFNTPRLTSPKMDIAKMLAKLELIDDLKDENFESLKQVRAGLTHFSTDMNIAKGQLAASTMLALAVKPQIIHVVSFTEANHAAKPEEVIESCSIVKGVLKNTFYGMPDYTSDPDIVKRKNQLVSEAKKLIELMQTEFSSIADEPLTDPYCLSRIVKQGFLDAPQLKGNPAALGKVKTMPVNGAYETVDDNDRIISHSDFIKKFLK